MPWLRERNAAPATSLGRAISWLVRLRKNSPNRGGTDRHGGTLAPAGDVPSAWRPARTTVRACQGSFPRSRLG